MSSIPPGSTAAAINFTGNVLLDAAYLSKGAARTSQPFAEHASIVPSARAEIHDQFAVARGGRLTTSAEPQPSNHPIPVKPLHAAAEQHQVSAVAAPMVQAAVQQLPAVLLVNSSVAATEPSERPILATDPSRNSAATQAVARLQAGAEGTTSLVAAVPTSPEANAAHYPPLPTRAARRFAAIDISRPGDRQLSVAASKNGGQKIKSKRWLKKLSKQGVRIRTGARRPSRLVPPSDTQPAAVGLFGVTEPRPGWARNAFHVVN